MTIFTGKKLMLACISMMLFSFTIQAQVFADIAADMKGIFAGCAVWGDYDNDGDLDLFLSGDTVFSQTPQVMITDTTVIYRNDGSDVFTCIDPGIPGTGSCRAAWGDYDNDGDLDILLTGTSQETVVSEVYRNDGSDVFTSIDAGLQGVWGGAVAWGDYDNDGDLDILFAGHPTISKGQNYAFIYRNDGNDTFTQLSFSEMGNFDCDAEWGDLDNDNDLDIVIALGPQITIFRNDGNDSFSSPATLNVDYHNASVALGDCNNDGDLDIVLSGEDPGTQNTFGYIFSNEGNFSFNETNSITGICKGSLAWGDYDNDGNLDILETGKYTADTGSSKILTIFRSDDGFFTHEEVFVGPMAVVLGSAEWGDYDNDGDLDIALTGKTDGGLISKIYKNNSTVANTLPSVPENLSVQQNGNTINFSWDSSSDNETPDNGLTYNLRIGTDASCIGNLSPMSDTVTGYRLVPAFGNGQLNTSHYIADLPIGIYKWSVQAIDNAFAASAFAEEQTFSTLSSAFTVLSNAITTNETDIVTYAGNASGSGTYHWDFDDAIITSGSGQGPYEMYWLTSGVKNLKLFVEDSGITSDTTTVQVTVNFEPAFTVLDNDITINETDIVTYVGNASGSETYHWDFDDAIVTSGSGQGPYEMYWLTSGVKNLKLFVEDSGITSDTTTVQVTVNFEPAFTIDAGTCFEETETVTYIGISPGTATYTWDFDGATIVSGTGQGPYEIYWQSTGEKNVSLFVTDNAMNSDTTNITVTVYPIPTATFNADNACGDETIIILYTGTGTIAATYNWDFDGGNATGSGQGPYQVNWTAGGTKHISLTVTENGCTSEEGAVDINVQYPYNEEICMITVDTTNGKNLVVWEKTHDAGTQYFNIYREGIVGGVYDLIGSVPFDSVSIFTDNDANPAVRSYRYKISAVDTCDSESELSSAHKTMHLTASQGTGDENNLIWEDYEGFSYGTYYIYRGTTTGNLQQIDVIPNTITTYTDLAPPPGLVYYRILIDKEDTCFVDDGKVQSGPYSQSLSNLEDNSSVGINDTEDIPAFYLMPNPARNIINISLKEDIPVDTYLYIYSADGKCIHRHHVVTNNLELDIGAYKTGIYFFKLVSGTGCTVRKLVKY